VRRLGTEQREFLERATSAYQDWMGYASQSASLTDDPVGYLVDRGLGDCIARYRLGWVVDPLPGHEMFSGRISIPYLTPAGVVNIKFRCIRDHVCKDAGCPKYLATEGSGVHLYNARAVLAAQDTIVLCEGEFDAMAVSALAEVPASGYPGTHAWQQQKHWPRVFAGLDVVVVADGDDAGIKAAKVAAKSLPDSRIVVMPDGEDANSMLVKEGADAFRSRLGVDH
jgi:DNA primase